MKTKKKTKKAGTKVTELADADLKKVAGGAVGGYDSCGCLCGGRLNVPESRPGEKMKGGLGLPVVIER